MMKRMITLLLALCCLAALCACGKTEPDGTPSDSPVSPSGEPSPSASAQPSDEGTSDPTMQLAWDVGTAVLEGGFDTIMDRGTYTVNGVECRLFYYVKDNKFAGEVCVAPDDAIYVDIQGTLNWMIAQKGATGKYTLTALPKPPEVTTEPEETDEPTPESTDTPTPEETPSATSTYVWPVYGFNIITFAYGEDAGGGRQHAGMDIAGTDIAGQPVLAIADGTVNYIGEDPEGYGTYVTIKHENGDLTFSLYAQLADYTVSMGQSVNAGDVIGHVGMSGSATGYHLHLSTFATWDWTSHFDPMRLFDGVSIQTLEG